MKPKLKEKKGIGYLKGHLVEALAWFARTNIESRQITAMCKAACFFCQQAIPLDALHTSGSSNSLETCLPKIF